LTFLQLQRNGPEKGVISQIGDQRRLGDGPKEVAGVFRLPAKAVARFCVCESGIQSDLTLLSDSRSIRNLLDHLLFSQTASVLPDHAHFFPTEISVLDSHAKKRVHIFLVVGSNVSGGAEPAPCHPRTLSRTLQASS